MRLALMIMGLAVAAVMGLQSFQLLTHPFATDAVSSAAGTGLFAAFIVVIGAAFTLQYPVAAVVGYGLAALITVVTGSNSPFSDLQVWGAGLGVLTTLAVVVTLVKPSGAVLHLGKGTAPVATMSAPTLAANPLAPAANGSPAAESTLVDQLERLGKLRASGGAQ